MPAVDEDTVNVELPVPPEAMLIEVGLTEAVSPEGVEVDSPTEPAKPLTLPNWIVEVPEAPARRVRDVGLAEIVKSTTTTVTCTECDSDPIVPVIVTV